MWKELLKQKRALLYGLMVSMTVTMPTFGEEITKETETSPVITTNFNKIKNYEKKVSEASKDSSNDVVATASNAKIGILASPSNAALLEDEEVLNQVVAYCHTTHNDFLSLVNYIKNESNKNGIGYESEIEVARIFYEISQIPFEEKLEVVKATTGLSKAELNVVASVISAEAKDIYEIKAPCYIDSYGVINNLYSRTKSTGWVMLGKNIYQQAIAPRQYEVFPSASKHYLGIINTSYYAMVDYLYAIDYCKNNGLPLLTPPKWTKFRSAKNMRAGRVQLVREGNAFFGEMAPHENLDNYVSTIKPIDYLQMLYYAKENTFQMASVNLNKKVWIIVK